MRLQLALNVGDLDEAVAFYSKLFATEPAKLKPGYANFEVEAPPLKLVLIENPGAAERLNHLGVEVERAGEVTAAEARLARNGLETTGVAETTCCFAEKTETWVADPDGARWEWYVKQADSEEFGAGPPLPEARTCCAAEVSGP